MTFKGAGRRKFAVQRSTFCHCATQRCLANTIIYGHCCYCSGLLIYVGFILQMTAVVLIQLGRHRGVRSTGVLFIYWILQFVSAVLALQAHARTVAAGVINLMFTVFDLRSLFCIKNFLQLVIMTGQYQRSYTADADLLLVLDQCGSTKNIPAPIRSTVDRT